MTVYPHHNYVAAGVVHHNSGGTEAGAAKLAHFVLHQQPPPRKNTPFWVISNTYQQVCGCCWAEKLFGHQHIPECEVDWSHIRYYDPNQGWPFYVPLKPWPNRPGKNWVIEFKSYEQGRANMQARSIGGFWFSEQFPPDIFIEVLRACREYMYPGGQFCEFTPIDPELCLWMEAIEEKPPEGWKIYRANTASNRKYLASTWYDNFVSALPEEVKATRLTGALASYSGAIYTSFNPKIHVVPEDSLAFPPNCTHYRGLDWGATEDNAQAVVWAYKDGKGCYWVYDEYLNNSQASVTLDHAVEVIARSIAWGWPAPPQLEYPQPLYRHLAQAVEKRLSQLKSDIDRCIMPSTPERMSHFGPTFGDPSRPGEMAEFGRYGIQMAPGYNDLLRGIDAVRTLMKVNEFTGETRLYISSRCENLIRQLRKYRWKPGALAKPLHDDQDLADSLRYLCASEPRYDGSPPTDADYRRNQPPRRSIRIERKDAATQPWWKTARR